MEDINVVCSCLKAFLRLLDEPLVTRALRPEFVSAGELFSTDAEGAKFRAAALLEKLPIANRDTLAFLILHLKVRFVLTSLNYETIATENMLLSPVLGCFEVIGM